MQVDFFLYFRNVGSMATRQLSELIEELELRAPSGCAERWDNVGLLAGDHRWKIRGAIVAIDLTRAAIEAAKGRNFNLIVNHHPCIFPRQQGLSRIMGGESGGKAGLVFEAVREGIAIVAAHTNFDRCALEVIELVSKGLGLTPRGRLISSSEKESCCLKLSVFVPLSHIEQVRQALGDAGAGHIGNYDFCSFATEGEGRFRGSDQARPFLGIPGRLETVREVRLETLLPRGLEKSVIQALKRAHPYEEVAYDLYPIEGCPSEVGLVRGMGYGFWGEFPTPRPFSEVRKDVRRLFKANGFLFTSLDNIGQKGEWSGRAKVSTSLKRPRDLRKIAFAAGSGASVMEAAMTIGCDLMITGEVGYHDALSASVHRPGHPMSIMELGHSVSERFFVTVMRQWLANAGLESVGVHVGAQKFCKF